MIRMREFSPSEDVLNAIRSLRANDDGMEPLERDVENSEPSVTAETPPRSGKPHVPPYNLLTTGRYLRVKV